MRTTPSNTHPSILAAGCWRLATGYFLYKKDTHQLFKHPPARTGYWLLATGYFFTPLIWGSSSPTFDVPPISQGGT